VTRWKNDPQESQALDDLRAATPARVGIGNAGLRPGTASWLQFRQDHAMAKDAVKSEFSQPLLNFIQEADYPIIQSLASGKLDFISYPPKGKQADVQTLNRLRELCPKDLDVQIVICDGLSAQAIEQNLQDILPMIVDGLKLESITCGKPVVVRYGRVAIADQIAHALGMKLAINLIGERPGLSTSGSMSAYLTYNPGPHTISSDRTVVSNIHSLGTLPVEAGAYVVQLAKRILALKMSGVKLQQNYNTLAD
jgi:ethanolamine ammonia-lyase small subunit